MQYGEIVAMLFVAMLIYYAALIILDIQRARAAKASELEKNAEVDIDISDEAKSFQPVKVSRDEPGGQSTADGGTEATGDTARQGQDEGEKPFRRPGFREAVMTDGILVEKLISEVDRLAETGTSDLGAVIYTCENAR